MKSFSPCMVDWCLFWRKYRDITNPNHKADSCDWFWTRVNCYFVKPPIGWRSWNNIYIYIDCRRSGKTFPLGNSAYILLWIWRARWNCHNRRSLSTPNNTQLLMTLFFTSSLSLFGDVRKRMVMVGWWQSMAKVCCGVTPSVRWSAVMDLL